MHPSHLNEEDMFDAIDFLTNYNAKGIFIIMWALIMFNKALENKPKI